MPNAVIIDDDDLFRESLTYNLTDIDFQVRDFAVGQEAIGYLARPEDQTDIVLLDWKMPAMNGIEVLKALREHGIGVPVIFLTALGDQIYEEAALAGGAVDFVEKSRSFSILRRRIELVLSRRAAADPEGAAVDADETLHGDLTLKPKSCLAYWRGAQVEISATEYRMIEILAEREGDYVPYRDLYDMVHGPGFRSGYGAEGYRGNVRTFIKRIRGKFKELDAAFDRIENYPNVGYRWRPDD
ncbi:MAG: response regulator transcription factor [Magnetospiraceae bacterium]